jgi:hypothetical protein
MASMQTLKMQSLTAPSLILATAATAADDNYAATATTAAVAVG